ncbi:hypothetical protein ACFL1X_12790 [Candidatus Hydrogenedentota bacterium]
MPSILQKMMVGEELLVSIRLLKSGLRELNRMDGSTDFFHLPILLLSSGFERMMKVVICCHYLKVTGEFPDRSAISKKPQKKKSTPTHDLKCLLERITQLCFSDDYLSRVPAAKDDIEFLRTDDRLTRMVTILSEFAQSARFYNLNVVLGDASPGPSPDDEWQKLEMELLKDDPLWTERISDPKQSDAIHAQVNKELTFQCEKLARSLSRLFTIGGLGAQAKKISSHTHHFLFLSDNDLGMTDYEKITI